MTTFPQFSSDPNYNSIAYIATRDQLSAFFENYALYANQASGGLLYYDSAGLNIGFGYNITGNINTARTTLQAAGLNFSDNQWDAIVAAAEINSSNYATATVSQLATLNTSINDQVASIAASDAQANPAAPADPTSISQSQAYILMNNEYDNVIDPDAAKTFAHYNITPDPTYTDSITEAGLEDEFYNTDKGASYIAAFGSAASGDFANGDIEGVAFETAFLTNSSGSAGLESRRLAEAFVQLGGTITLGLSEAGNPVVTGVNFSLANVADLISFASYVALNASIVTDSLYNQDNTDSYTLGFNQLISTLATQGYYVPQPSDIVSGDTAATWDNIANESIAYNLNGPNLTAQQLQDINAVLPGVNLSAGGLVYVPISQTSVSNYLNPFIPAPQTGSGQAFVLDPTSGSIFTIGASLDPDAGDLFVENTSGTGDAVTFDEDSYTNVSYSNNILSTTITDESGGTIGTFTSNVSSDNNFNVDTSSSATNITVTGTGNLDTTSADTDLSADTLTFDGQSIAGNFTSGVANANGLTYTLSGTTLTVSTAAVGGTPADTLTINGFQPDDFGVFLGPQFNPVALPAPYTGGAITGMNDNGVLVGEYTNNGFTGSFIDNQGSITPITIPGPTNVEVVGISDNGIAAGTYYAGSNEYGFLDNNGDITTVSLSTFTSITGISANGRNFVGLENGPSGPSDYASINGVVSTLDLSGLMPQATGGISVTAINDEGELAGTYQVAGQAETYGFTDLNGEITTFTGPGEIAASGNAHIDDFLAITGINDEGQVTGYSGVTIPHVTPPEDEDAQNEFVYANGTATVLPNPSGNSSTIYGINNRQQLAGSFGQTVDGGPASYGFTGYAGSAVSVTGTGNVDTSSNSYVVVSDAAGADFTGSQNVIYAGGNDALSMSGSYNTVTVSGNNSSVADSGTGNSFAMLGQGDTVSTSGATVAVQNGTSATLVGNGNNIAMSGSAFLTLGAGSDNDTVTADGTGNGANFALAGTAVAGVGTRFADGSMQVSFPDPETVIVNAGAEITVTGTDATLTADNDSTGNGAVSNTINWNAGGSEVQSFTTVSGVTYETDTGYAGANGTGSVTSFATDAAGVHVTLPAAGVSATLSGGNDSVTASGSGDTVALGGTGDSGTVSGAGDTAAIAGSGNTFYDYGTGDNAITLTGGSDTAKLYSTASGNTVTLQGLGTGNVADIYGSNYALDLTGSGETVVQWGGSNETIDTVGGDDAYLVNSADDTVTVTGGTGTLVEETNAGESNDNTYDLTGTGNTLQISGSGDMVNDGGAHDTVYNQIGAGGNTVNMTGASQTLYLTVHDDTVNVSGDSDLLHISAGDLGSTVTLTGNGDQVLEAGSGDIINMNGSNIFTTLYASNDTVFINGSNNSLHDSGTGGNTIYISGTSNGAALLSASGDTVYLEGTGTGDGGGVYASHYTVNVTGTDENITDERNSSDNAITFTGTGDIGSEWGTDDTVNMAGTGTFEQVYTTGNFLNMTGTGNTYYDEGAGGNTVTISGSSNTAAFFAPSSGNTITLEGTGAGNSANVQDTGNTITATGSGEGANDFGSVGGNTIALSGTSDTASVAAGGDTLTIGGTSNTATLASTATTGSATISGAGALLNINGSSSESIVFDTGASGIVKLLSSSGFSGTVAGLASGDSIDLKDFLFSGSPTITSATGSGAMGTNTDITVTEGAHSVTLALLNQYANQFAVSASAYTLTSDSAPTNAGTLLQLAAGH